MKELSMEQKAKAYDKAIERAKKHYEECKMRGNDWFVEDIEDMFPELKESEGEKMIKFIKQQLFNIKKTITENYELDVKLTKAIDWLEKQDKETSWKPSKEEMDVLYSLAYITNQHDEHKEEVITHLYQDLKREFFNGSSYENMYV